jgi:hypothetical protein
MELGIAGGIRVLHRDLRAELDVLAHGIAKRGIGRHFRDVERCHIQLDEAPALLFVDLQPSVHRDQVCEAELAREPIWSSERFCRERGQMIDVMRIPSSEQRLQERVGKHAVVEDLLEAMKSGFSTGMLE